MSRITSFSQLVGNLKSSAAPRKKAAIVWAADSHTREAVATALSENIIDAVFIGCRAEVETDTALRPYIDNAEFVEAHDCDEAAAIAASMAREGKADIIMKGMLNTDNLLRALLNKEKGILAPGAVLTHITAAEAPGMQRIIVFSDAAVIPYPTPEQRRAQIGCIISICRGLGIEAPKIALVHCSEKVDERHFPFTADYAKCIAEAKEGAFGPCVIDGPLDVKTSLSAEALKEKKIESPLCGESDALVFPDIEAANTFYKTISLFCHSLNAGMLMGAKVPVVLPSRGDTSKSKFLSLALAASI